MAAAQHAFFLPDARGGQRFCIHHAAQGPVRRGQVVYVHPFTEEMNKSRRMAALQSRALAGAGFSVLQIDLAGCGDLSYWLATRLLANLLPQARGRSASPATNRVGLSKPVLALWTAKTPFPEKQLDPMISQGHITLLSCSSIVDLLTALLALWADSLLAAGNHFHLKAPIRSPVLSENTQFWQTQWDQNAFFLTGLFCAMLIWQDLSSRSFGVFVLTNWNEGQVICSVVFPPKDGDPKK